MRKRVPLLTLSCSVPSKYRWPYYLCNIIYNLLCCLELPGCFCELILKLLINHLDFLRQEEELKRRRELAKADHEAYVQAKQVWVQREREKEEEEEE